MKFRLLVLYVLWISNPLAASDIPMVATIRPLSLILGELVPSRRMPATLMPPGTSPHSFELKPSLMRLTRSSILFYVSPSLESWAQRLPAFRHISVLAQVPQHLLLFVDVEAQEQDAHFWLDPLAVRGALINLTEDLCSLHPPLCSYYKKRLSRSSRDLEDYAHKLYKRLKPIRPKAFVLSHPFFRYFLNRFDLKRFKVLEAHAHHGGSMKRLEETIKWVRQKGAQALFVNPQLSTKSAEIVSEATGIKIYALDPLGANKDIKTYRDLIETNAEILLKALK